jgi:hypothetical protein
MKFLVLLTILLFNFGCGNDHTRVINNSARVSDLERRMSLNEQLDAAQSEMITINSQSISAVEGRVSVLEDSLSDLQDELDAEIEAREQGDASLASLISQEATARSNGDTQQANDLAAAIASQSINNASQQARIVLLQNQMLAQSIINLAVQGQISSINSKFPSINSSLSSLQSQVNSLDSRLDLLEPKVSQLRSDVDSLGLRMGAAEGDISSLESQALALTARIDAEGVKVFKCNSSSSTERMFKINGKYYAVMNRVTTKSAQIITGSSSQTLTVPKLCKNGGDEIKLPQSNGNCKNNETQVSGTGVSTVVPSYSTSSITVVDSVKIALDILSDGSYQTTDGGPACSFSVSGGVASNLIQVQ